MNRNRHGMLAMLLCAALALLLAGCGGDDGVSPTTHMDVEEERDMYKAQAEELQEDLDEATDEAERLQGELNTATTSLNAATMRIGSAPDANGMGGSGLLGDLATQMAMVASLTMQINGDGTPDNPGLAAQLQAAMMQIGEAPGPDGMGGSGLLGDLAAEMAKVAMYMEMVNGDGTPDNPGLQARLNAANERIASLLKGEDPEQVTPIADDASTAATDARTAATKADEYADQAEMDDDNRATIQTGDANSVAHAMYARAEADKADEEAGKADTAATMAAAATTTADANKYLRMATDAKEAAETARDEAKSHAGTAATDSMAELKINGSTKSVGDTSITVNRQSRTSADGRTITGLLSNMDITQTGTRDAMGHLLTAPTSATDSTPVNVNIGGTDLVADTVDIGFTYDSADDDARLTLIHSYLGSKKEMLFIRNGNTGVTLASTSVTPTSPFVNVPATTGIEPDATGSPEILPTGSIVVPYADAENALGLASAALSTGAPADAASSTATRTNLGVAGIPSMAGVIARAFDETEGTQPSLYYIDSGVTDNSPADGIDQTRIFLERRVTQNEVTYDVVYVRQVTLDDAMAFEHIHYGLWNGISGRDANTVADLGIGFVTALADGGGMTAADDMPNVGTITYNGNWVANVQRAAPRGNGEISRRDGSATIMANVEDNEVDVTLAGLATLEGMIDGNMFSGSKATLIDTVTDVPGTASTIGIQANYGLDGTGKFEGSFSGGFFGPRAAEAGGVFDFSTEDNHEGAFRGSFGGAR